ncbi:unnamed protein product, partial [Ectocarpus sp. 8 AP-2014]
AVEFLHSIKLIHTDLKPENVLLKSWEDRSVTLESGDPVFLSLIVAMIGYLRSYNISSKPAIFFVTNSCFLPGTFFLGRPGSIKTVIDFGGATYEHDSHASVVNTRQYRAPEVILGLRWLYPSDLWSVGCIIAELFLGDLLFATHHNLEHLALMEKCVGLFPPNMLLKAPRSRDFFDLTSGLCKGATECDSENRRHIRRMKRLE